jgi:hypothetical protein
MYELDTVATANVVYARLARAAIVEHIYEHDRV